MNSKSKRTSKIETKDFYLARAAKYERAAYKLAAKGYDIDYFAKEAEMNYSLAKAVR